MLNYITFDNQIKIWWDYRKLQQNQVYNIYIENKLVATTTATNFSIKELKPNNLYNIKVKLGDIVLGEDAIYTTPQKNKIDVTKAPYYALGDNKTINTKSIQQALDDCKENDFVFFPNGIYLTGSLFVKSNTEIVLDDDATLQGATNVNDYKKIKSRFEGIEEITYASLLNVGELDCKEKYNTKNVIIRGGKIFGGGQELRKNVIETERVNIVEEYRKNGASEDELFSNLVKNILPGRKRGRLIQVANTENFIIADTECGNSPSWNLHYIYSNNITTCGVKVVSKNISNGDGVDIDSSANCLIFDAYFDTGDDCVAIKSGKNPEGNIINRPTNNVKIFDIFANGGWGLAIGSEMSGGVENIKMWNLDLKKSLVGLNVKAPEERGGYVKNVYIDNAITPRINISQDVCYNQTTENAKQPSKISDLFISDIIIGGVDYFDSGKHKQNAITILGSSEENPISNVSIKNITLNKINISPTQQMFFRNVKNVSIENIISK